MQAHTLLQLIESLPPQRRNELSVQVKGGTGDSGLTPAVLAAALSESRFLRGAIRGCGDSERKILQEIRDKDDGIAAHPRQLAYLESLQSKGLVFPLPGKEKRWFFPREYVFSLAPEPILEPYRSDYALLDLWHCLRKSPWQRLQEIAHYHEIRTLGSPVIAGVGIWNHLRDPKRFAEAFDRLSAGNQATIEELAGNGGCRPGYDWKDRNGEDELLFRSGLVYVFKNVPSYIVLLPREVVEFLDERKRKEKKKLLAGALSMIEGERNGQWELQQGFWKSFQEISRKLHIFLPQEPLKSTQQGQFHQVSVRRLTQRLDLPDTGITHALLHFHVALGWLQPGAVAASTSRTFKWLDLDDQELLHKILKIWLDYGWPRGQEMAEESSRQRSWILEALRLSEGCRITPQALSALQPFIAEEANAHPEDIRLDKKLDFHEVAQGLQAIGLVELARWVGEANVERPSTWSMTLTPLGAKCFEPEEREAVGRQPWSLIVVPSLEVYIPWEAPLADLMVLSRWSDVKSLDRLCVFQITTEAVKRALHEGGKIGELKRFLTKHTSKPLPPTLFHLLDDLKRRQGEFRLFEADRRLEVSESHLLAELRHLKGFDLALPSKPKARSLRIPNPVDLRELQKALQQRGFLVSVVPSGRARWSL